VIQQPFNNGIVLAFGLSTLARPVQSSKASIEVLAPVQPVWSSITERQQFEVRCVTFGTGQLPLNTIKIGSTRT
jgi:hypothetical protein